MPNLIATKEALLNWVNALIEGSPTLGDCRIRLIRSAVIIDADTTQEELVAAESGFPGYSPVVLSGWTDVVIIGAEANTEADTASFTATGSTAEYVHGCFITSLVGDDLWLACAFDPPIPAPFSSELQVDTSFNLRSLFTI